ncbi:MAG TPA: class I SAM-dependent methyltransferase [Candidatus Binataceae bacterium]|nr:class I SAM-dependent methyltransferase [Candidatus Binataceae bacterium]
MPMGRPIETDIYRLRFSPEELRAQRELWQPICRFLQNYVACDGVTLDLGAGPCHFINQIESRRKLALDLNEENLARYAAPEVEKIVADGTGLPQLADASVDTIFASNVYEHFRSREDVAHSLSEALRVLRPGGRMIILQPNFAYCAKHYFDFFDHRLIFTDRSMAEILEISRFAIEWIVPKFLPFTTKSRIPQSPWLVALYLKTPLMWRILGAQMLIIARKPTA